MCKDKMTRASFLHNIQTKLNPERYQGHNASAPYFEGWYYKLVDKSEKHAYAIIPGISLAHSAPGPHAFIQVMDGKTGTSAYHTFPLEAFWAAKDALYITIGQNHFTAAHLSLNLPETPLSLRGELTLCDLVPWPGTWRSPGIMGWYSWVPQMECYHGIVSLDHSIHGTLTIDGQTVDFTDGQGYIEKDWGRSHPSNWIWLQSNHFQARDSSLTASIATIPGIGILSQWTPSFQGFLIGLLHQGTLYRFATYTGAETEHLEIAQDTVTWVVRDRLYRLHLTAHQAEGAELRSPREGAMQGRIMESLQGTIDVRLSTLAGDHVIFEDIGRNAGIEIVSMEGKIPL